MPETHGPFYTVQGALAWIDGHGFTPSSPGGGYDGPGGTFARFLSHDGGESFVVEVFPPGVLPEIRRFGA